MDSNSTKEFNKFINKSTQYNKRYYQLNNRYQLIIGCCLIILSFVLLGVLIFTNELAIQQVLVAIIGILIIAALDIFKSVREDQKIDSLTPSIKLDNRTFVYGDYNSNSRNRISNDVSNQNEIVVETVAEIQKLLNQSSVDHPVETAHEKMIIAAEVVDEIENNPTLKQRVTSTLKLGGIAALGSTLVHPAAGITIAALAGWLSEQETKCEITDIEKG